MTPGKPPKILRAFFLLLILLSACLIPQAFARADDPLANPQSVVRWGDVRITVLTPQLLRLEWAEGAAFEDSASLVFINRNLPSPPFQTSSEGEWSVLKTDKLGLRYRTGSGRFAPENLSIELNGAGKPVTWKPGTADSANLGGTVRTLDDVRGDTPLEPGLVSRDGWVLVDDSRRPLFDHTDWPWVAPRPKGERQDWYFFGHGHDYKQALRDFIAVAGRIPLPPHFAFGTWWSRYWAYTDAEFQQLVREFESHGVPLDVLVIDMDWHLTFGTKWSDDRKDQAGQTLGWTGYTWNKTLFPDPEGFLRWCHERGLKTTMNLHPASGVQPHEERYAEMARAMGIDPASQKYVPFDITSKRYAENYLKILHYPLEQQGVDFWWLDYQQRQVTGVEGLNPTWWLNYVHTSDMERRGKRPLIFHRWGGLGNHRFQIGFSGDTISVWESLAFQPYFTSTAANVGYGYWSHDIGGHMPGEVSPELYSRWIQFGVFSPILRTHTTKNPKAERRIWAYPAEYAAIMRDAYLLRYALIPYIYTAAREAYDAGISICRPMYYDYPEADEAYDSRGEYMFGDDLLVAPVTVPLAEGDGLAAQKIWLPPGTWVERPTGAVLRGPAQLERKFVLDEIPVYARAGAVIPMQPDMRFTGEKPVDPLILEIYPQAEGSTRVYEDAGNSLGYKSNECAWTEVRHSRLPDGRIRIEILPAQGLYPGMPLVRAYEIRLAGMLPPEGVSCNGTPLSYRRELKGSGWRYDGDRATPVIRTQACSTRDPVEVLVQPAAGSEDAERLLDGYPMKRARLEWGMGQINTAWPAQWSPDLLVELVQTGRRLEVEPKNARQELEKFARQIAEAVGEVRAMELEAGLKERVLAHLRTIAP